MKPKSSSASSSSIRQFGQRSITSNFSSQVQVKKSSPSSVSLLEFLDRKLDKSCYKAPQDGACSSGSAIPKVSKVISRGASDVQPNNTSGGITISMFEQLKRSAKDPQKCAEVQDGGTTPVKNPCDKRVPTSLKRKSFSTPDDFQQSSGRLFVLGDDPKPNRRLQVQKGIDDGPRTLFNHYADGGGWWDTDMVGLDSDEIGTTEIWEGMGSTTIGGL